MATEDIDMTWRLQLAGHDVMYEPAALFGMEVPETLPAWWRQRCRWALGLAQVLRRHGATAMRPRNRRIWPVLITSSLSMLWAHALVVTLVLGLIAAAAGRSAWDAVGALSLLGAATLAAGLIVAAVGMRLDSRRDPGIGRQWLWVPWYPLLYWMLCASTMIRMALPGIARAPSTPVTWAMHRDP
jgi:biofilm PGA synthesis N-glycosyltransferase PgaC